MTTHSDRKEGVGGLLGRLARIEQPIFIVGSPRSGTSTLLLALSAHPELWSLHREATDFLEGPFHPDRVRSACHALDEQDLGPEMAAWVESQYYSRLGNLELLPVVRHMPLRGRGDRRLARAIAVASRPLRRPPVRMVEKTVQNAFRVPFLRSVFPDARFIHLSRHPRAAIAAIYRGWRRPDAHLDYPLPEGFRIADLETRFWSFVLPPHWRGYGGRPLLDICAFQWASAHEEAMRAAGSLDDAYLRISFEELLERPVETLRRVAAWAGLDAAPFDRFREGVPRINASRGAPRTPGPATDALEKAVESVWPVAARLGYRTGGT